MQWPKEKEQQMVHKVLHSFTHYKCGVNSGVPDGLADLACYSSCTRCVVLLLLRREHFSFKYNFIFYLN
jgi:hypothetical protein